MENNQIPVLLITFNRPQYLIKVLDALKISKVTRLLIFRDGPRPYNQSDIKATQKIKDIIDQIDWISDLKVNLMQNNLGCGYGPYSAISWAFQYTDKLIILEDDCIPVPAFFTFCNKMLYKYENDKRIRLISGRFPISLPSDYHYDYIFTQWAQTWGWATWKRVWDNFDLQQRDIMPFFNKGGFKNVFPTKTENSFFNSRRYYTLNEPLHSWDGQFGVHARMNGELAIVPTKNLIQNIGTEGTHVGNANKLCYTLSADNSFECNNEPSVVSVISEIEDKLKPQIYRYEFAKMFVYRFYYYLKLAFSFNRFS